MKKASIESIEAYVKKADDRYWNDDFTSAMKLSEKGLIQAKASKDYERQIECLLIQMKSHMSSGEASKAKRLSATINKLASDKCSRSTYANALIESGYLYLQYLEYKQAEEFTVEALIIARDESLPDLEADALVQLASLDSLRQNFKEASVYLREALKISKHLKRTEAMLEAIIQQGLVCGTVGDYDRALELFEQVESLSEKHKLYDYQVESILNQGDIFRSIGDFDKAERLYNNALDKSDKRKVPTKTAEILRRVGNLLLHKQDFERALEWYRFCEKQIKKFKSESYFPFVALGFGTAYNGLEDYKRAVEYFWRVLDTIAPSYFLHSSILKQVLEQLSLSLGYLNKKSQSKQVGELAGKVRELTNTGIDSSHQTGLFIKKLENELNILIESLKTEQLTMFSRDGVRVDLKTGEIYGDGNLPINHFSNLQLEIFRLLVENEGTAVSNKRIIGCYETYVDDLQGVPRRAHYFIAEIRNKLGSKKIIKTETGSGYKIPRL
ncbi:MAG TPA: tetratricopeptide repeat protein [Acidobacteriota bacterium]|nr:tetratricopeptide repeat protein [Acidobacteriota bacterium]